ncbi:hypothetical protein FJ951_05405 [Mesorhizobium sp. B2-2-3]|uniref:hypothetical protein n=1 Tax=Mesorhizobium sp. B2-2-3 TaxID=2589963 RepID=UPI00112622C9|nr:hypothetical protein [Mesorhizobium sp. B2-2-3]TPM52823.1 hypothetical protein FJ951_05405 [Mesorhizobium sp. B2-2-3]
MALPPVEGALFRRNYVREPVPLPDSTRARRRFFMFFHDFLDHDLRERFAADVVRKLGVNYAMGAYESQHGQFWTTAEIPDLLSAVTIALRLSKHLGEINQERALARARQIISEEGLHYRIDDAFGVHYLVDEEFTRTSEAALAGLGQPRFAAASHALDEALGHLDPANQSGKALIRGVFEAVESAFLVVINQPTVNRLNAQSIDAHLKPILMARHASYAEAQDKVDRAMEMFKAWVHSAHPFRHGAALAQIHEAPIDLAIMSATQGMGFLRYIVATP